MSDDVAAISAKINRFMNWNGDDPAPQITHWTPSGTIIIRAATPRFTSQVFWRPRDGEEVPCGFASIFVQSAPPLIFRGEYDIEAGEKISAITPLDLYDWNDLG